MHAYSLALQSHSEQSKALETVQLQACQIIIGSGKYSQNRRVLDMDSLHTRRQQQQTKKLLVHKSEHGLYNLLPPERDQSVIGCLLRAEPQRLLRIFANSNTVTD